MNEIVEEWQELSKDYKELEAAHQKYMKKLKELTESQNVCLAHIAHQRRRLKVINKNLKDREPTEQVNKIRNEAIEREAHLQIFDETMPRKGGRYLRIILGNVDVAFMSQEARFKYKDEYEKFKLICHILALLMLLLNIFFPWRPWEQLYLFFLVWYYCTITIRESVLRANGSKISGWWRFHHALSVVCSGILLVWPENEPWYLFKGQFFRYNMYNCLVQYLQFKYQRGALYRLKALGKKDNMDVTIEGFQYWMWRGLAFLFPFLFVAYFYQLYNSVVLYRIYTSHSEASWHVLSVSMLMFVFFLGNSVTTLMVVPNKIKNSLLMKYKVMTRRVLHVVSENIPSIHLAKTDQ